MIYSCSIFEKIICQFSDDMLFKSSAFVEWPWFNPDSDIAPLTMKEITDNLDICPTKYPDDDEYNDDWDENRKRKFEINKISWLVNNFNASKTSIEIPRLYNRHQVCLIDGNHTLAALVYLNLNIPVHVQFSHGIILSKFIDDGYIIECNIDEPDLKKTIGHNIISFSNGHTYQISQDGSENRFWMNEMENGAIGNFSLGPSLINSKTAIYFYGQPLVEDIPNDGPGRLHRFLTLSEMITGDPFLDLYDSFLNRYPIIGQS